MVRMAGHPKWRKKGTNDTTAEYHSFYITLTTYGVL